MVRYSNKFVLGISILAFVASARAEIGPAGAVKNANVDDARLLAAADDGANWISHGRTADEQRNSPLTAVNDRTVAGLGLAWSSDLDTARGQEATPIVVDGVMFVSTAWSMVKAYDAATGAPLWSYDPEVPREKLVDVCCDAVNRGVAVYKGKVFVATIDGRLVALNADTGQVVWDKMTIPAKSHMAITGAPRIVKGRVLIGAAGSEYITRGYLAAFDPETGKEAWRFYTVPGDPSKPAEGNHLVSAAKSWSGEWWKLGGGGTVWDSITYDPQTDLVYFGTANAEPWNPAFRNTKEGDNLYTASIVAIHPDTGEYAWHFQETPEDRWDFDSDQQIIAATLPIDGKPRRVVMHAPKNGFFYVLDGKSGKFISGKPFVTVNWATGLDPVTGRPNVNPEARYEVTGKPFLALPSATGGHTWNPMSYSAQTGLVYIPTNEAPFLYASAGKDWKPTEVGFQIGIDLAATAGSSDPKASAAAAAANTGALVAWDPVAQKARWTVKYPGPTNGGTLVTAGNLVFQGTAGGEFRAYTADAGKQLWSFPTQTGCYCRPDHLFGQGRAICGGRGRLGRCLGPVRRRRVAQERARSQHQPRAGLQAGRGCGAAAGAADGRGGARPATLYRYRRAGARWRGALFQQVHLLPRRSGDRGCAGARSSPLGGARQAQAVAGNRPRRAVEGARDGGVVEGIYAAADRKHSSIRHQPCQR
jgi:quinohemoprotein ethanol dehydrogenase